LIGFKGKIIVYLKQLLDMKKFNMVATI